MGKICSGSILWDNIPNTSPCRMLSLYYSSKLLESLKPLLHNGCPPYTKEIHLRVSPLSAVTFPSRHRTSENNVNSFRLEVSLQGKNSCKSKPGHQPSSLEYTVCETITTSISIYLFTLEIDS